MASPLPIVVMGIVYVHRVVGEGINFEPAGVSG